jgi:hypothetical protein
MKKEAAMRIRRRFLGRIQLLLLLQQKYQWNDNNRRVLVAQIHHRHRSRLVGLEEEKRSVRTARIRFGM